MIFASSSKRLADDQVNGPSRGRYLTGVGLETVPAGKQISVTGLPGDAKSADHHKKAGLIPTYCGHSETSLV